MARRKNETQTVNIEWLSIRDQAERVECRRCAAAVGEHCRTIGTRVEGRDLAGPAHWQRIRDAGQLAPAGV